MLAGVQVHSLLVALALHRWWHLVRKSSVVEHMRKPVQGQPELGVGHTKETVQEQPELKVRSLLVEHTTRLEVAHRKEPVQEQPEFEARSLQVEHMTLSEVVHTRPAVVVHTRPAVLVECKQVLPDERKFPGCIEQAAVE
jgi:hypothetical protein